jgi:hypothetical protein
MQQQCFSLLGRRRRGNRADMRVKVEQLVTDIDQQPTGWIGRK